MTPAEIKKTRLYRTLSPCVRKEDREELARMLAMVPVGGYSGMNANCPNMTIAFTWSTSPQGYAYWHTLYKRLKAAGHSY